MKLLIKIYFRIQFDVEKAKAYEEPAQWDISEDEDEEEVEDDDAVEDSELESDETESEDSSLDDVEEID